MALTDLLGLTVDGNFGGCLRLDTDAARQRLAAVASLQAELRVSATLEENALQKLTTFTHVAKHQAHKPLDFFLRHNKSNKERDCTGTCKYHHDQHDEDGAAHT